jgi:hypothetical protein
MNGDKRENTKICKVIVNDEEQYSIWPADRINPRLRRLEPDVAVRTKQSSRARSRDPVAGRANFPGVPRLRFRFARDDGRLPAQLIPACPVVAR